MIVELAKYRVDTQQHQDDLSNIAEELGLELQARRYHSSPVETAFKPLSDDEWRIWNAYCPTSYSNLQEGRFHLKNYAFDTIPGEVLRHWKTIKDTFAFDSFQIWTTERTQHYDPLLIGILGEKRYLLARWADEAPGLLPVAEVAWRILERYIKHIQSWPDCRFTKAGRVRAITRRVLEESMTGACLRVLAIPVLTPEIVTSLLSRET